MVQPAGARLSFIARYFLSQRTPYECDEDLPSLPDYVLRVRLSSFDCASFVYSVVALCGAGTFEDFVHNLRCIRYAPGSLGPKTYIRFTSNGVRQMSEHQLAREVTREIAPDSLLRIRHVPALGMLSGRELFKEAGDPNIGQPASIAYIPSDKVEQIDSELADGDIVLLISAKPAEEYPDLVAHCGIVHRAEGMRDACLLHASRARLGSRTGPHAGVSVLTRYDETQNALLDDGRWRTLASFLVDNPDRWAGIAVLRAIAKTKGSTPLRGR